MHLFIQNFQKMKAKRKNRKIDYSYLQPFIVYNNFKKEFSNEIENKQIFNAFNNLIETMLLCIYIRKQKKLKPKIIQKRKKR